MADHLSANFSALRLKPQAGYPGLVSQIELAEPVDWAEPITLESGYSDLSILADGKRTAAYGSDEAITSRLKGAAFQKDSLSLIVGACLGRFTAAIFRQAPRGHTIIWVEPEPYMLRLALAENDFSVQIKLGLLHFTLPDDDSLNKTIKRVGPQPFMGPILTERESLGLGFEYFTILNRARELVLVQAAQVKTQADRGLDVMLNIIKALPKMVKSPGVRELAKVYQGQPAIIVAAGPSLNWNLHQLKAAQGKAVIIALAQTARALLNQGVKPDFIVAVDMQRASMNHLEGLLDIRDIALVASCQAYHGAVNEWQGPVYVAGVPVGGWAKEHYLTKLWENKGLIPLDSAAVHFAYRLALYMGADPVVFVGLDLAVTDQGDHFKDYQLNLDPFRDKEAVANLAIQTDQKDELIDGYWGKPVRSRINWMGQKTLLEKLLEAEDKPQVVNATEGGAKIKGTSQERLVDVIAGRCQEPIQQRLWPWVHACEGAPFDPDMIVQGLQVDIKALNQVIAAAGPALEINHRLSNLIKRNGSLVGRKKQYPKLLKMNIELSLKAQAAAEKVLPLVQSMAGAYRAADNRRLKPVESWEDKAIYEINKNRVLLLAAKRGAETLLPAYEEAIEQLAQ